MLSFRQATVGTLPTWKQIKLFRKILTFREKYFTALLILLLLSGVTFLTFRWYDRSTVLAATTGGEYNEGIVGSPRTANILLANTGADLDLTRLTSRGLLIYRQEKLEPDLAESWTIGPDQRTYTITVKDNLRWSDGIPLTAKDVFFTFTSLQNKNLHTPLGTSFKDVKLLLIDDKHVRFILKEPYASFLNALTISIIPAHVWQPIPVQKWTNAEANLNVVGTGPFRLKAIARESDNSIRSISLEKNPFTHTSPAYLDAITLKFYPDLTSATLALRQGSINGLASFREGISASLSTHNFNWHRLFLPGYSAIFFNSKQNQLLQNKKIRQGLRAAINQKALVEQVLNNHATPTTTFLNTYTSTKQNDTPAMSSILTEAGYTRNDRGQYLKDNVLAEFTLTVAQTETQTKIGQALAGQLSRVGIKMDITTIPNYSFQTELAKRNYEAILASEVIGLDSDPYPFWHSSQAEAPGLNLAQFQNDEADKILVQARQTLDASARAKLYEKFENILAIEAPAIFLYNDPYNYIMNPTVRGAEQTSINQPSDRFNTVEKWYVHTARQWKRK